MRLIIVRHGESDWNRIGRYQGQQAAIIAVAPAGGGPVRIWVVGTGCSATSSDVITQMALSGAG